MQNWRWIFSGFLVAAIVTPLIWWLAHASESSSISSNSKPKSTAVAQSNESVVKDVLVRAAALDPKADVVTLRALLQSVAGSFQEIEPGTTYGQAQWRRITLNKLGAKIDGFRFKTPADQTRELDWAFLYPKSLWKHWGIKPMTGSMRGFGAFDKPDVESFSSLPKTTFQPAIVVQNYPCEQLSLGREYFIWFKFQTTRPIDMWVALDLVPPKAGGLAADALGLK